MYVADTAGSTCHLNAFTLSLAGALAVAADEARAVGRVALQQQSAELPCCDDELCRCRLQDAATLKRKALPPIGAEDWPGSSQPSCVVPAHPALHMLLAARA